MNYPKVSIIIPAKNAQNTIQKCLDSILNLNYKNFEVIVVNDGSIDDTEKILKTYNNIKVITTKDTGPSSARNIAIEHASGEFIAFTDADCIADTEWINELLGEFLTETTAGAGGSQKSPKDETEFGRKIQEFFKIFGFVSDYIKSGCKTRQTTHNPTCNVMYRKSVLIELGGFLEGLWPGEDVELDYRIKKKGYGLIFNPAAIVYHYRVDNFKGFCRMMFNYGRAQGQLFRKYGFFRIIHFVPLFVFIFLAAFLHNFFFGLFVFILIGVYLFIKLLYNPKNTLFMLCFSAIGISSWNLGFLYGLFKRLS